jgi:hypothetical protein
MDNDSFREVLALARDWAKRTDKAEKAEYNRLRIGDSGDLYPTINTTLSQPGAGKVVLEHWFLIYGRFVDMGAGPGAAGRAGAPSIAQAVATVENKALNRERATGKSAKKVRRPKKFYSVIFYGRLNALMGVVSGSMQEQAVRIIHQVDPAAGT